MRKRILLYLVIVIQTVCQVSGVSVINKHLDTKIKLNPECRKIKCPSVSEPLCVRLKYVTSALQSRTVYVVMINRCEMKYVTCHEGVEAKVLPMVHCDHGKNVSSDLTTLVERRRKMDFKILSSRNKGNVTKDKKDGVVPATPKLIRIKRKAVIHNEKKKHTQRDKEKHIVAKKRKEMLHINAVKQQLFGNGPLIRSKKAQKEPLRKKKQNSLRNSDSTENKEPSLDGDVDVPPLHVYTKDENEENEAEGNDFIIETNGENGSDNEESKKEKKDGDNSSSSSSSGDWQEYTIASEEVRKLEEVNMEEYKADCPKMCPARGVMMCGRCKDGIYRTFLSTCHMRMFDCGHPEEKLSLVAHHPCAMSGPYLEDLRVPKGRIDEFHDEDVVLRFLKCKEYKNKKLKPYSKLNCTFDGGDS